ncbi:MAG: hypothetical protein CM15mV65_210 [Caudoviricetes sp.]|nr:MAG: hypothetical protein CM15mV65_210 [Caudoviricetes sp.]
MLIRQLITIHVWVIFALSANTTGTGNNAFGSQALITCTTGNYNSAIGNDSGKDVTTGSNNMFFGHDAGRSNSPSGSITK